MISNRPACWKLLKAGSASLSKFDPFRTLRVSAWDDRLSKQ